MDIQLAIDSTAEGELRKVVTRLITAFTRPAFGSLPKREADILMFEAMRDLGVILKEASVYELMTDLRVTRAKAQQLLFDSSMRSPDTNPALLDSLVVKAICQSRYTKDNNYFVLEIENPLVQAHLKDIVRRTGHVSDTSFNSAIIRLSEDAFRDAVFTLIPDDKREDVRLALVAAGAKDTSMKGVLTSATKGVARLLAGAVVEEAAGALFGAAANRLGPLLAGNVQLITKNWAGLFGDQQVGAGAEYRAAGPQ